MTSPQDIACAHSGGGMRSRLPRNDDNSSCKCCNSASMSASCVTPKAAARLRCFACSCAKPSCGNSCRASRSNCSIDHAGHSNDIERNILETIEFSKTVQTIFDGVAGRDDTLILVTADHETGGLKVHKNNGKGQVPDISWSTGGHTVSNVPLYGWGRNAERVGGIMNNTDLIKVVGLSS